MTQQGGSFDKDLIRELAALLEETGLTEIEVEHDGKRIRVARGVNLTTTLTTDVPQSVARENTRAPTRTEEFIVHPGTVTSPMVGTAYLSPEPSAPPFVGVGSRVVQGQTILIIEAMKTMNHIPAPKAGVLTRILVGNRQPVEFGEPLAIIE